MDHGNCKKCGQPLSQESKHIMGIHEDGYGPIKLRYQIVLTCPAYNTPFGWLTGHTRLVTEYHD